MSTTNLANAGSFIARGSRELGSSIVLPQVHAGIQRRDLFGVAIEGQRWPALGFADALLGRLAPARVIDLRVDVGVKAIFVGPVGAPRCLGLAIDQVDLDDRLDPLEPVLPWHHQPNRRTVLWRQFLAVQS